jgi:hypothetical protein
MAKIIKLKKNTNIFLYGCLIEEGKIGSDYSVDSRNKDRFKKIMYDR